jgi:hypothetical protein
MPVYKKDKVCTAHDKDLKLAIMAEEDICDICGACCNCWSITDSEWEYAGTAICAGCLRIMATSISI